jgi:hypothetical protein
MATTTTPQAQPQMARWGPASSVGVTLVALLLGQAIALIAMSGFGGRDGVSTASAVGLFLADVAFLAVVLFVARRGARRVTGATLGLRRTRFWPAVGWSVLAYLTMVGAGTLWMLLVGGFDGAAASPMSSEEIAIVTLSSSSSR